MEREHIVGFLRLVRERACRGLPPALFGLVTGIAELHIEIRVLPDLDRAVANGELHLVAARRPIPARRHHGDVRNRLMLAWLQEQDVAGRRHLPGDTVAERNMGDLLVRGELDLHGGPQRAYDPGDIVRLVVHEPDTTVL